jgi:conjugal transfer pilus assembly protein TraF
MDHGRILSLNGAGYRAVRTAFTRASDAARAILSQRLLIRAAAAALLVVAVDPAAMASEPGSAQAPADAARFVDRTEEGWFWYRDPPPEPEPPEEPETVATPAAAPAAPTTPPAEPAGPTPLSAEWIEANIKRFQLRATDDPTPENVRAFLLLQKVMMDKAQGFTDAVQLVTLGDPLLDATFQRPLASFGVQATDRAALHASLGLLNHLSDSVGFVFFFRSDCPYCDQQAPRLLAVAEQTGMEVLAVSIDGGPMPSGAFPDYVVDQGQAAQLGVMTTPTIMLMRPPFDVEPVSQGVVAEYDLMQRTLVAARRKGWISQEAFEATKPYKRVRAAVSPHDIPAEVLEDPAAFVAHLRAAMLP